MGMSGSIQLKTEAKFQVSFVENVFTCAGLMKKREQVQNVKALQNYGYKMECLLMVALMILLVLISTNRAVGRQERYLRRKPFPTFVSDRVNVPGRFVVLGVNHKGQEIKTSIYAVNLASARSQAEESGIMVTFVSPS